MESNTSSDIDLNILDRNGRQMNIPSLKKDSSDTDLYLNLIANPVKSRQESENSTSSLHLDNDSKKNSTSSIKRLSLNSLKMSPKKEKKESFRPTYSEKRHTEKHTEKHTEHNHSEKNFEKKNSERKSSYRRSETDSSRARYESVDVSSTRNTPSPEPVKLTPQQIRMRKTDLLRKLCDLKAQGYQLTREYNFNSDIDEMENEFELLKSFKQRRDGIKLYKNTIVNVCNLVEFFNGKYDPFGADLNGWSEHMSVEVDSYDEVLEELYEKYKSVGKSFPPELKLLILIGFSASAFHFSKKHMSNIPSSTNMVGGLQSSIAQKIAGMGKEKSKFMTEQELNIERQKEAFRQKDKQMKETMRQKYAPRTEDSETQMTQTQTQTYTQTSVKPPATMPNINLQNGFAPVNFGANMTPQSNLGPPSMVIPSNDPRDSIATRPLVQSNQSVKDILKRLHERDVDTQETQEEFTATNDRLLSDTTASESKKRGRKKKPLMTIQ
jgi:hypothetical protein